LAAAKSVQLVNPENGAVASSKPSIPNEVTQAAPKLCLSMFSDFISMPSLLVINERISIRKLTRKAGTN